VRKELKPELRWVLAQIAASPLLRHSPPDLVGAISAHIAWYNDFGASAIYRKNNNLSGLAWSADLKKFRAEKGDPDSFGVIARFPNLEEFVDAYLYQYEHLLKLSAREFFEHQQKNDLSPNASRRWAKIAKIWEEHFASGPVVV
jgi:hypothetical protein